MNADALSKKKARRKRQRSGGTDAGALESIYSPSATQMLQCILLASPFIKKFECAVRSQELGVLMQTRRRTRARVLQAQQEVLSSSNKEPMTIRISFKCALVTMAREVQRRLARMASPRQLNARHHFKQREYFPTRPLLL